MQVSAKHRKPHMLCVFAANVKLQSKTEWRNMPHHRRDKYATLPQGWTCHITAGTNIMPHYRRNRKYATLPQGQVSHITAETSVPRCRKDKYATLPQGWTCHITAGTNKMPHCRRNRKYATLPQGHVTTSPQRQLCHVAARTNMPHYRRD